jgi:hypothetical protein
MAAALMSIVLDEDESPMRRLLAAQLLLDRGHDGR